MPTTTLPADLSALSDDALAGLNLALSNERDALHRAGLVLAAEFDKRAVAASVARKVAALTPGERAHLATVLGAGTIASGEVVTLGGVAAK